MTSKPNSNNPTHLGVGAISSDSSQAGQHHHCPIDPHRCLKPSLHGGCGQQTPHTSKHHSYQSPGPHCLPPALEQPFSQGWRRQHGRTHPALQPAALRPVLCRLRPRCHAAVVTANAQAVPACDIQMDTLTAVTVASLTLYVMCKVVSHNITITDIKLDERGKRTSTVSPNH